MKNPLVLLGLVIAINSHGASQDLVKGVDMTSLTSVTTAQLNQLVDNATPATGRGFIYVSATAPNTVTYPRFTNYLWLDTSTAPPVVKAYSTAITNWDSASIPVGGVTSNNLAANSVISGKIQALAVWTTNLNDNIVTDTKIQAGAITATKYAAGSITTGAISNQTITAALIVDGAISTVNIGASQITTDKIAPGTITTTNIATGTISGTNIASNTITQTNVADQGIGLTNIVRGTASYAPRVNAAGTALEYVSGGIVGVAYTNITTCLTNAFTTPAYDDSIPEVGEGMEIASISYTPKYANSVIHIHATIYVCATGANQTTVWAVKDGATTLATANAISGGSTYLTPNVLDYYESSASLTARTYSIREGGPAATVINGDVTNGRRFGGKLNSVFTITEILQ